MLFNDAIMGSLSCHQVQMAFACFVDSTLNGERVSREPGRASKERGRTSKEPGRATGEPGRALRE